MTAKIFQIQRFSVHNGDGIRTTVFFKGCPLRCAWCHNPEGLSGHGEIAYFEKKCTLCTACAAVCPEKAHRFESGVHLFDRDRCRTCTACTEACPSGAMLLYGKEYTLEELLPKLTEDRAFYEASGGGVTLSGGECLLQAEFCAELLARLKAEGIHTAVDTCGFIKRSAIDAVLPHCDLFLYDLKAATDATHLAGTGVPLAPILENLRYLNEKGAEIEIRIPFIPEYNAAEIEEMAELLAPLGQVKAVRVLPYHKLSDHKYRALGLLSKMPERLPTKEEIERAEETLRRFGLKVLST